MGTIHLIKNKTIFIATLDWGFGHTTRCVPLIRQLMIENTVILGTTPTSAWIFEKEFPGLRQVSIEPYNIRYSRILPLWLKLLFDSQRILRVIKKEHEQLKAIIKTYQVDLIISDNRFGLYHDGIESIYLSHQLSIKAGIWSGAANRIHHHYIRRFSKVWVPDFDHTSQSLAGELSVNPGLENVEYIGPLSRLNAKAKKQNTIDYLVLLSGVEPQRSMLEERLLEAFRHTDKTLVFVRGSGQKTEIKSSKNILMVDLAGLDELSQFIRDAETVICRSGYSSLMDMHAFQKKQLILIPTPGQTEQEYLAGYWKKTFGAEVITQGRLRGWKP